MKQVNLNHQQLHSILTNDKFVFIDRMSGVEVDLYQDSSDDDECYLQYCDEEQDIACTSEVYNQAEGILNIYDNFVVELVVIMPDFDIELSVLKFTTESDFSDYLSI